MANKVILTGNVGKDPEIKSIKDTKLASFSLATSESYKDKSGEKKTITEWHNIDIWGKLADVVEKYVHKGDKLYVEGKITYQNYEVDGVKKSITKINVSSMEMLSKKPEGVENKPVKTIPEPIPPMFDDFNDDLPF